MNPGNTDYRDHILELQTWLAALNDNVTQDKPELRSFYIPEGLSTLDYEGVNSIFDNTTQNEDYQREYDSVNGDINSTQAGTYTGEPVAYLQTESDNISSLAKMFIYRHQPRLKNYRDDCENKGVRTYSSISTSLAKLAFMKRQV